MQLNVVSVVSLFVLAVTAVWSTAYLNKAMMYFGNNEVRAALLEHRLHFLPCPHGATCRRPRPHNRAQVVPVYYTTFTLASVAAGAVVYSEFSCLNVVRGMVKESVAIAAAAGIASLLWGANCAFPALGQQEHTLLFCFGCLLTFVGVYLVASGRGDSKKFKGGKRCALSSL